MNLQDYEEMELADIEKARKCVEESFRRCSLMVDTLDFEIKAEWVAEYAEVLGSIDWLIVEDGKQLEYIPTITFLFWLSDRGYITEPKYKNPDNRVQMYIWHWGGYVGSIEKRYKSILSALEIESKKLREEIDKMVV